MRSASISRAAAYRGGDEPPLGAPALGDRGPKEVDADPVLAAAPTRRWWPQSPEGRHPRHTSRPAQDATPATPRAPRRAVGCCPGLDDEWRGLLQDLASSAPLASDVTLDCASRLRRRLFHRMIWLIHPSHGCRQDRTRKEGATLIGHCCLGYGRRHRPGLAPNDVFKNLEGLKSWLASIAAGLVGLPSVGSSSPLASIGDDASLTGAAFSVLIGIIVLLAGFLMRAGERYRLSVALSGLRRFGPAVPRFDGLDGLSERLPTRAKPRARPRAPVP